MRKLILIILLQNGICFSKQNQLYVFASQSSQVLNDKQNGFRLLAIKHEADTLYLYKREEDKILEYDSNGDQLPMDFLKSTFDLNNPDLRLLWRVKDSILTIGNSNFRINLNKEITNFDDCLSDEFYFFSNKWNRLLEQHFNDEIDNLNETAFINHTSKYWYMGKIRKASTICLIKSHKKVLMNNLIILDPRNYLPIGFRYFEISRYLRKISHVDLFCVQKCKIKKNQREYVFEN